jgi:aspartyl-tRNA(Asn)/glutamyl-tRNA(Gln) amidotransferase subunit C
MKVTEKEVAYVADLANLDLTPEERRRMLRDLNSILEYVDTLGELDTTNVAPMAQVMTSGVNELGYARRDDALRHVFRMRKHCVTRPREILISSKCPR